MFEIPNHNPISTPSQVRKSKKSRKTSKRLLKKVYTCIMILLTTQTKEKKMHKPTIDQLLTGEVEWKILDKMIHNWQGLSRETLQASIDALWYQCTPSTPTKQYQCHGCRKLTPIKRGDNTCQHCNTGIYWGTV